MHAPSALVVGVAGAGVVFIWSAIHGAQVSTTLRDVLAGHATPVPETDPGLVSVESAALATPETSVSAAAEGGGTSRAANRANGQLQAAGRGWIGEQWTALDHLWTQESDWNNTSLNPSSGAYGIAQFLPATWADYGATKTSDPTLQIRYGLTYIANRYGTPAAAWAHEQSAGWY
jgi:resuscitation-promoting factor RpfB